MDNFIRPIINIFPTWERDVWNALQKKDWVQVNIEFNDLLSRLEKEEVDDLPWEDLIESERLVRGQVSEEEWKEYMYPILTTALINFVDGPTLANIYSEITLPNLISFHKTFLEVLPGESIQSKFEWLKENKPSFYIFFVGSPINGLGIDNYSPITEVLSPEELQTHYNNLSSSLKSLIFDYWTSETIQKIGQDFHFSDEKIKILATIIGQILIGFIHQNNLFKEIKNKLTLDDRITAELNQILKEIIIEPLQEEINLIHAPISDIIALRKKEAKLKSEQKIISLEEISAPKTIEQKIGIKTEPIDEKPIIKEKEGGPLVLHKEKSLAEEKKTFIRPFSLPFKIFQTKTKSEPTPLTRAKIEGLNEQTTSSEKKKPLIFKKETSQKIVHYNELRTPLEEPFIALPKPTKQEEIINLEIFASPPTEKSKNNSAVDALIHANNTNNKNNKKNNTDIDTLIHANNINNRNEEDRAEIKPQIEGNVIDLSKKNQTSN